MIGERLFGMEFSIVYCLRANEARLTPEMHKIFRVQYAHIYTTSEHAIFPSLSTVVSLVFVLLAIVFGEFICYSCFITIILYLLN